MDTVTEPGSELTKPPEPICVNLLRKESENVQILSVSQDQKLLILYLKNHIVNTINDSNEFEFKYDNKPENLVSLRMITVLSQNLMVPMIDLFCSQYIGNDFNFKDVDEILCHQKFMHNLQDVISYLMEGFIALASYELPPVEPLSATSGKIEDLELMLEESASSPIPRRLTSI